jgi:hypothetical protein
VFVDEPGGSYWRDWREYVETHLLARGLISREDGALFRVTDSVDVAIHEVMNFYSNYHSSRYVGDRLVVRVRHAPGPEQLAYINETFADVVDRGKIVVSAALPEEDGEVAGMPRIVFENNRHAVGRLRMLIDHLNTLVGEKASAPGEAAPHAIVPTTISDTAREAENEE